MALVDSLADYLSPGNRSIDSAVVDLNGASTSRAVLSVAGRHITRNQSAGLQSGGSHSYRDWGFPGPDSNLISGHAVT